MWQELLTAFDGAEDDEFGISACVHGDTLVVGSRWDDDVRLDAGSAHVYRRAADGRWVPTQKLVPSDANEDEQELGFAVGIWDGEVVTGAPNENSNGMSFFYFAPELSLEISPDVVVAGDTVDALAMCGKPGTPILVSLVEIDGVTLFLPLLLATFGADGTWSASTTIDASVPPAELTMMSFAFGVSGKIVASNLETLTIQ